MGRKYILIEGSGKDEVECYEPWELKHGTKADIATQFDKQYLNRHYPISKNSAPDCSEYQFWRLARDLIFKDKSYIIVPSCGNSYLGTVLYHLYNRSDTDEIILLADWYAKDDSNLRVNKAMREAQECCETPINRYNRVIKFRNITGYTFEYSLYASTVLPVLIRTLSQYYSASSMDEKWKASFLVHEELTEAMKGLTPRLVAESRRPEDFIFKQGELKDYDVRFKLTNGEKSFEQICTRLLDELLWGTGFKKRYESASTIQKPIESDLDDCRERKRQKHIKSDLGDCWKCNCKDPVLCDYIRDERLFHLCGLHTTQYTQADKLKLIFRTSHVLMSVIEQAGIKINTTLSNGR